MPVGNVQRRAQDRFATRPAIVNTFLHASCNAEAAKTKRRRVVSAPARPSGSKQQSRRQQKEQEPGIRELNPRLKQELKRLGETQGLEALAYVVLVEAVDIEDPPEIIRRIVGTTVRDLEQEEVVVCTPPTQTGGARGQSRYSELLQGRGGNGPSLLALVRFLLSQGKTLICDSDAQVKRMKRDRFESSVSALCFQLDPKYICEIPAPLRGGGCSKLNAATHCFLLRLHSSDTHVAMPRRLAVVVCDAPGKFRLEGLKREVSHVFDRLEQQGVQVIYVHSWEVLEAEKNIDIVYVVGHTDGRNDDGAPVITLDGQSRTSAAAARSFCNMSSAPQLVVFNGCHSFAHAEPVLQCGVRHVICWDTPVPDMEAVVFGETLIDELVKSKKVEVLAAFQKAHKKATKMRESQGKAVSSAWACLGGATRVKPVVMARRVKEHPRSNPRSKAAGHTKTTLGMKKKVLPAQKTASKKRGRSEDVRARTAKRMKGTASEGSLRQIRTAHSETNCDEAIAQALQQRRRRSSTGADAAIALALQEEHQQQRRRRSSTTADAAIALALQEEEVSVPRRSGEDAGCCVM